MLARLVSEIRRYGTREGFRAWWRGSSRREYLTVLLFLDCLLFVLWAILLFGWMNNLLGYEGVVSTDAVGWILILWLPVINVLYFAAQIPVLRSIWGWLVWVATQFRSPQVRTRLSMRLWRLYWIVALGGCIYLVVGHRPWGLFAALFAAAVITIVYLVFHVGGNFGSGIPDEEILAKAGHHPIGFFVFGLEALPGVLKLVGIAPIIWILLWPLVAYANSSVLGVGVPGGILQSLQDLSSTMVYWKYGCITLIYWLGFAWWGWRRHGDILTKNHMVVVTFPTLYPLPGTRRAEVDIERIAKNSAVTVGGVCVRFDPGLTVGDDPYADRWMKKTFLDAVWEEQHRILDQQTVM